MLSELRAALSQSLQSSQQELAMRNPIELSIVEEDEDEEEQVARFGDRSKDPEAESLSTAPGSPEAASTADESEAAEGLATPPRPSPRSSLRSPDGTGSAREIREDGSWRRVRFMVPESSPRSRSMEAALWPVASMQTEALGQGSMGWPGFSEAGAAAQRTPGAAKPPRSFSAPSGMFFQG